MAKNKIAEILEKKFAGAIDKNGNPLTFEDVAVDILSAEAFPDEKKGKESNPALLTKLLTMKGRDDVDPDVLDLKKRDLAAHTRKLEIDNAKEEGQLIERAFVAQLFGKIYQVHRSIFIASSTTIADTISANLKLKNDTQRLKIEEVILDNSYIALKTIKREINDFLKSFESDPLPEDEKEKLKKSRKKRARTT